MSADSSSAELAGREAAHAAILGVLTRQMFVSETLGRLRDEMRLSGREAGLATEIALGAVRHIHTLETILSAVARYEPTRVQPPVRAILLAGAYQAIWMDRVPLFAAVNESVTLVRKLMRRKSVVGMVNAILRRLSNAIGERRGVWQPGHRRQARVSWDSACEFSRDIFPASDGDDQAYTAAAGGERPERFAILADRFGADAAAQITWASQAVPAVVLHRNALRIDTDAFQQRIDATYGPDVTCETDRVFLPPGAKLLDSELFRDGLMYVQDSTAQAAARLVDARPGERVLDFCAAPGGKSVALAVKMEDRGEVVACDTAPQRLIQVSASADRLGLTCIHRHLLDGDDVSESLSGGFDAALVDTPCSNTGVIARRPEARLGFTARKVASLNQLQAGIIRRAARLVRPGGRLVYSTCCLEPEENQHIVAGFLADNPEWRQVTPADTATTLPDWGATPGAWRDGGFAVRLERTG